MNETDGAKRLHETFLKLAEHRFDYGAVNLGEQLIHDDNPWLDVWLRSELDAAHTELATKLHFALCKCESPIEKMFMISLAHTLRNSTLPVERIFTVTDALDRQMAEESEAGWKLIIEPQVSVGKYRADFQIDYWYSDFVEVPVHGSPRGRFKRTRISKHRLYVECDGHDFHERTKDQAARDRKRDRDFQQLGLTIFRFTGSEIWKDPTEPAYEVMKYFLGKMTEDAKNNAGPTHENPDHSAPPIPSLN